MKNLPIPDNEQQRITKLYSYNILDTEAEQQFDDLTMLAAEIFEVPICLITLVDEDRQWFKSKIGLDVSETSREVSFCQYAIMGEELLEVEDANEDERFRNNPLVTDQPKIRFYARAPLIDDEGLNLGTLCVIDREPKKLGQDQKKALEALASTVVRIIQYRKINKAKDIFLSNFSHEIRTPLNAIIGFTDLMQKTPLNEEQSKYIDIVSMASRNLILLINDVLDVSRIESGKLELEEKPFSIKELLEDVIKLQAPSAKIKNIKLFSVVDHEIPELVLGDQTRLLQILINLVSNAIKFTEEGQIEIKASAAYLNENETTLSFSVKDTGIGIEEGKLKDIFKRFTQAETSTARKYGGTGLGLNIVKMLVEQQNGKVMVDSELGVGSEFSFEIKYPIPNAISGDDLSIRNHNTEIEKLDGIKILVVEDNKQNQLLASAYIKKNHGTLDLAEDGQEAIDKLKVAQFDIVLMDLQMPMMNGFEATEIIRKEIDKKIPIIACSAHSLAGEKRKCLQKGMNDYITKPYSESELVNTLKAYYKKTEIGDR
ncbi:MAG: ATP-binding protein [Cyclobacteriaceae bacterium]